MSRREAFGGIVIVAAAVAGHLATRAAPDTVAGAPLLLDHLFAVVLASALLAVCAALGMFVLHRLDVPFGSAMERLVFAGTVGAGALATIILLVCAAAGVQGWVLAAVLAGVALLTRAELGALAPLVGSAAREWRARVGPAATAIVVLVAATMLLLAVAPPVDTDSLNYHLRIPAQFLDRGRIHLPEDNLHVAWVGLAHFLYLPVLASGAASGIGVLNVCFALLLAGGLVAAAARLATDATARLAAVALWGSPIVLLVAITPKIDVTFALFLFLAHYALLRAWIAPEERGWLRVAALLLGFAVGIKILALPYIAAVAPLAIAGLRRRPGRRHREALVFGAVAAAAAVPWLTKNWALVGAPLYPELSPPLLPPWLADIHGASTPPARLGGASLSPLREVREGFNIVDWFVAPERLTPESEGRDYRANPVFALLILGLPLLRHRAFLGLTGPALLYILVAVALGTRVNLRYLVPVVPALTLASTMAVGAALRRVGDPRVRGVITAAIAVLILIAPARAVAHKLTSRPVAAHAAGLISRREFRLTSRDIEVAPYARLTERVNALLPADARVLLLFEPRGYGFTARVLQDNVMTNWVLLQPAVTPPRCLESSGITHVLVGTGTLRYFQSRGFDPAVLRWDRFEDFARRCLVVMDEQPDATLYRVARSG